MDLGDNLHNIKRVRFMNGQVLSAEDLEAEQRYLREKLKRHNRHLHGSGVVYGLEISIEDQKVHVSPGFALDCTGEEISVPTAVRIDLPTDSRFVFLMIAYKEIKSDPVPGLGGEVDDTMMPSRIEESFELLYEPENPYVGHEGDTAVWMPCNHPHALPLAKLVQRWDSWEVDPWFEPPSIAR
jgi:hypothetical protein